MSTTFEDLRSVMRMELIETLLRLGIHDYTVTSSIEIHNKLFPRRKGLVTIHMLLERMHEIGILYPDTIITEEVWSETAYGPYHGQEIRGVTMQVMLTNGVIVPWRCEQGIITVFLELIGVTRQWYHGTYD